MDKIKMEEKSDNNKISNVILFLYQFDVSKVKNKYYYAVIALIFYSQLYSILIVSQKYDPDDTLLKQQILSFLCLIYQQFQGDIVQIIIRYFGEYAHIQILIASYSGIILLLISIFSDILYIYYIRMLMNSSTNQNHNIIEKKRIIIQFVGSFSELSKWILYIIKIDLALGSLFCNDSARSESLDKRCSNNLQFSGIPSSLYIISGIISLLLTLSSSIIANLIYINIDFQKKNPLKPQLNLSTMVYFGIVFGQIFFSYISINNSFIASYIIAIIYCLLQLKDYLLNFPIVGKQILFIYGNLNLLFLIGSILCFIRDQAQNILEDNCHLIFFLLIGSILCGCNSIFVQIYYYKLYTINLKQFYGKPLIVCQYLSEICELLQKSVKDNQAWLVLMGILEFHQTECEDQYCPCQEGSIFQGMSEFEIRDKKKEFSVMSLDQGLAIPPQGIWLSELRKDYQEFKFWLEDFVEYHFYQIVEHQDVYFYFWSFEIYNIKNYVKALYLMKQHYGQIKTKSWKFIIVEDCISMIIEGLIKQRDKSLIYSNKQGDIQDAMLVRKFSHLFHSEFQVILYKKRLRELINKKIDMCDKLINNYSSLQNFNKDVKNLVKKIDQIDKDLRIALNGDPENVHYLKLLSLINQALFCHPQQSLEYEGMLNDITTRDRSLEKDVIHSLSIINGDVASIVMSYKDQKCQLERYSNRTPNFFGYSNEEFKVIKNPEPFIPDVIAVYHNYYVGRIVREGNPKILRRYRQLVAKSKNGYLFPVKLFADYFFNIHDTLCFSALVLKLQTSCEYILVEHDGYIQGFSEGFFNFLRETSKCYDLDPNLLMQVNIKIVFPTLLEFLNKYDENGITPNMTNHFTMEIPLRLNDYLKQFIQRKNQLQNSNGLQNNAHSKKLDFVKRLIFFFLKLSTKFFKEQTTVYDVKMRVTKDFLQFSKDNQMISQNLFVLEITNMTISRTFENMEDDEKFLKSSKGKKKKIDPDQIVKALTGGISQPIDLQEQNNPFDLKKIAQDAIQGATFMESNLEGVKIESNLEVVKLNLEGHQESNQSMNLLQSQDSQLRKVQQQTQQGKFNLNEINLKPSSPKLTGIQNQNETKSKNFTTQITLNKYQEVAQQNESKVVPASVNIRRSRSKNDEHDGQDAVHSDKEKHELEEINKNLQSGFIEIIDGEHLQGILPNQEEGKQLSQEDVEKEFQKFCTLTSYVPTNGQEYLNKSKKTLEIANDAIINERNEEEERQDEGEDNRNGEGDDEDEDDDEEEGNNEQANHQREGVFISRNKTDNSFGNLRSYMETSNKQTLANKKSQRKKLDGNSNSYNDQGMAINSNVKEIAKIATERATPVFVQNLYFMFSFQWVVFIVIAIVSCLNYYQNFSTFQTSIDIMSFSANILQGQARSVLATNFMLMENLKLLDFSSDSWHSSLLNHILPIGFQNFQDQLDISLQWPLSYPGLQAYQESLVTFDLWIKKTQKIIEYKDIPVPSSLSMIGMSIYEVVQNQNKSYINYQTYPREISVNQKNILQSFNVTNQDITNSIEDNKTYFSRLNLIVLIIGLFSIICSFGLIFKSLHILQTQEKKILGLISRISEDDALQMISLLELSRDCVDVSNQDYLTANLRAFDETNLAERKSLKVSKRNKQKRIKSNYLNDRIVVNRLNTSYSYFIISILLILSCATLLLGFINFQSLINNFNSPMNHNNNFLISYKQYSSMIMNFDTLITSKLVKQKLSLSQGILTQSQEDSMTVELKEQLSFWQLYFNKDYSLLSEGIISDYFANNLREINEQNSCTLNPQIYDNVELQKCQTVMSGLMTKGFVPEINNILNQIDSAIRSAFSDNTQLIFYLEKENYKDQIKVTTLLLNIFNRIKDLLHDSITQVLDNYGQITILLFSCGSIGYTLLLIAGFSYFYISSFRDFQYLRRGVILMPYQRLALDNHTMNLLNNTLQIKK